MNLLDVDILIVALNRIEFDARLTNFIHTFSSNNFSVSVVALNHSFENSSIDFYGIEIPNEYSTYKKTYIFNSKARSFFKKIQPRIVLCSDVYSLPAGGYFKKRSGSTIVYDSREIYSALASLSTNNFKQWLLVKFENYYVRNVDKIIVTGELDKDILSKIFPSKKIFVVKNFPSEETTKARNGINLRNLLNIPDDNILMVYQGALLRGRGIELGIQSVREDDRIHFIILGGGPLENQFLEYARKLQVGSRVHFLGNIPYRKLLKYTSACDVGLCLIEPISLSYNLALPNKLFEYCHSGVPVIATELPAIAKVFREFNIGEMVSSQIKPFELAERVISLSEKKLDFSHQLRLAAEKFCWERQEQTILEIFK